MRSLLFQILLSNRSGIAARVLGLEIFCEEKKVGRSLIGRLRIKSENRATVKALSNRAQSDSKMGVSAITPLCTPHARLFTLRFALILSFNAQMRVTCDAYLSTYSRPWPLHKASLKSPGPYGLAMKLAPGHDESSLGEGECERCCSAASSVNSTGSRPSSQC